MERGEGNGLVSYGIHGVGSRYFGAFLAVYLPAITNNSKVLSVSFDYILCYAMPFASSATVQPSLLAPT